MTEDETARFAVLKLATDGGKFAIPLGAGFGTPEEQKAFEALLMEDWVRLIDVTPLAVGEDNRLYRVFMASDAAMSWFRSQH